MTIKNRLNAFFRRNTNPSPVIDEALYSQGLAYVDPLVFRGYNNFLNKIDKRASMYSDPIINTLTMGWANIATTKTFKFYDSHEIDGVEIMEEWRDWWQQNNLDELLKALIPHFCMDGWVLLDLYLQDEQSINYEVYGSFECDVIHWKRDIENEIYQYNVKFVPFPSPTGWAWGGSSLRSVSKIYGQGELLHFARGDWNYGIGKSRIAPIWDPAIKLRHGSYADFFRRDMRFIVAVPEGWKKKRVESFADSFNDMMRGSRRMFIYKMEQSEGPEKTPLELPRFGMESLARPAPKPMSQSEAGGELLRDPEWARLLAGTQLTENYFIGNQAGAVTGSEVDLTRDFYTECTEFGLLEPLIKGIINWFATVGLIPEPPSDYVIKYWKDWEHIEKAAQLMEQEASQWEQEQGKMVAGETRRKELRQQSEYIDNAKFDTDVPGRWITRGGKHIYLPFKERTLVLDLEEEEGIPKYLTTLYSHPKEETLYAEFMMKGGERESIELATHVDHMIKIKKWLEHRIQTILGTKEETSEYEKERIESYRKVNAMLGVELARHNKSVEARLFECMRLNRSMPMTPIPLSSWIKAIGYDEGSVYMQTKQKTKRGIDTYEYNPEDPEAVGDKWIESGSKGGYWWDEIRDVYSPAFKHGKPPAYLETGYGAELPFTETEAGKIYKEKGEPKAGIVGVGETRAPFPLPSTSQKPSVQMPSYTPFQETTHDVPMSTMGGESQYTPGRVFAPETVTGHKKVGPGAKRKRGKSSSRPAIIPYNPSISLKNMAPKLNSQAYIKRMAREMGWGGMSNSTAQKIMTLVKLHEVNNLPRYNSIVVGNVMDFDILLRYPDAPNGEKACRKEWKKIKAHEGNLYLYEDLGHGGRRVNVGKYKYWWDDKEGKNVVQYNKEEVFEEIEKLLNSRGIKDSEIQLKINRGLAPDLSTEYYSGSVEVDGIVYQTNFHNRHGEPVFEGIAIVEKGNCTFPACVYNIIYEEVIS